uniref:Uncharacterized protein LOC104213899 n=1 Tax=Nicotiana sylvestris TaxID=4096 RepID=A0A1U7V0H3_NICSY|nr:PREDICTED: uncharacterized protein LOC104213899 [Nicotiana sylvestris]
MAWRVQNYAMELCLPGGENVLLLNIDATKGNTMCTQIPRQISRYELVKIHPDSWITNYENLRELEESLQSGEPTFTKRNDKTVCVKILTKKEKGFGGSNSPIRDTARGILATIAKTLQTPEWPKLPENFIPNWEDSETTPKPKSPSAHTPESKKPPEPETSPTQKTKIPTQPRIFMLSPSISSHTQDFPSLQPFGKEGISHAPKFSKKNIVVPTRENPQQVTSKQQ